MAAAASASKTQFAIVPETTWGVTPATPVFEILRRMGGGMRTKKTTGASDEIQADRNTRDIWQGGQDGEGSLDFEMPYGSLDTLLASAMLNAWSTNVLSVGATPQSFTLEQRADLGGGNLTFHRFNGCMVNQMSLNFQARQKIAAQFGLMGQKEDIKAAIIAGATYTPPNTNSIETGPSVTLLTLAGLAPLPRVKSLSLQINNNLGVRDGLGDLYSEEFSVGEATITGTMRVYFKTSEAVQMALDHGGGALSWTVGKVTGKKYTFSIPAFKFTDVTTDWGQKNADIMLDLPWQATGSAGSPSLTITRAVA